VNDQVSPADLSKAAGDLLQYADPYTAGLWPRAAALLARQSLEQALHDFWARTAPGTEVCSMRAQLSCLGRYTRGETAEQASFLYGVLSEACHHHPYDLAPSATELQTWLSELDEMLTVLTGPS
jgi:hypothetical protein